MKKRTNVIFSHFSCKGNMSAHEAYKTLQSLPYSDDVGFGYDNIEELENVVYAILIKRTVTKILEYDSETKEFISREVPIYEEITFSMDFEKRLLYTYGVATNHNRIKSALRNTFDSPFTYAYIDSSPINIMDKITSNIRNYNIDEIAIQRFTHKNGAIGKYIAKITKQDIGKELIKEYLSEIQKISINIYEEDEFQLIISANNSISIKCEEDDFFKILENIKSKIYGGLKL